jgi:hypothetical protein
MEEDEFFPFLELPDAESDEALVASWRCLPVIDKDNGMILLLDILSWIMKGDERPANISRPTRVWDLYLAINARYMLCLESEEQDELLVIRYVQEQATIIWDIWF